MMLGNKSTLHHHQLSLWLSSFCSITLRSEGGKTSKTQDVSTKTPSLSNTACLHMSVDTQGAFSTHSTLHPLLRPKRKSLQMVIFSIWTWLIQLAENLYRTRLIFFLIWTICREIGHVGILGIYHSTQCDWKRTIWQSLAAHLWPMAQHHCPDTEWLLSPLVMISEPVLFIL